MHSHYKQCETDWCFRGTHWDVFLDSGIAVETAHNYSKQRRPIYTTKCCIDWGKKMFCTNVLVTRYKA